MNPAKESMRGKLSQNYLFYLIFYLLCSGIVAVGITFFSDVPDWFMFLLMYVVQILSVLLYVKAYVRRRRILRVFFLVYCELLFASWIWILLDRVKPRWLYVNEQIVQRDALYVLWVPIVMTGLAMLLMLLHGVAFGKRATADPEITANSPAQF